MANLPKASIAPIGRGRGRGRARSEKVRGSSSITSIGAKEGTVALGPRALAPLALAAPIDQPPTTKSLIG